jgi:putative sterol carrier protein
MVEPFSPDWCEQMSAMWEKQIAAVFADPEGYNYIVEWGEPDGNTQCQSRAERGVLLEWPSGKKFSDEECDFIIYAGRDTWGKLGRGELDPMEVVATGAVDVRKGDLGVIAKEGEAWKAFLRTLGQVPTNW